MAPPSWLSHGNPGNRHQPRLQLRRKAEIPKTRHMKVEYAPSYRYAYAYSRPGIHRMMQTTCSSTLNQRGQQNKLWSSQEAAGYQCVGVARNPWYPPTPLMTPLKTPTI